MELSKKLFEILQQAQVAQSHWAVKLRELYNIFALVEWDDFQKSFIYVMRLLFVAEISKAKLIIKCIEFMNVFMVFVEHQLQMAGLNNRSDPIRSFLKTIVTDMIKTVENGDTSEQYYFCCFCEILFEKAKKFNILDEEICHCIEDILLELLLQNSKALVRSKAATALTFLQNPANKDCKVIQSFLRSLSDTSGLVRKAIIESIAINQNTLLNVIQHIGDYDYIVRREAYKRFTSIKPQQLTIKERRMFLYNGFDEKDASVKRVFLKEVLPFWFKCYETNFLNILRAISITEIDTDPVTSKLNECIIAYIVQQKYFKTITAYLPIKNQIISQQSLNATSVMFWDGVHKYFMERPDEEFIWKNFPQILHFCDYISRTMEENSLNSLGSSHDEEFQFIIEKLFTMLHRMDLSEMVQRQKVQTLIIKSFKGFNTNARVISIQMRILEKNQDDLDTFIEDIICLALNIKENNINYELSSYELHVQNQRLVELKRQQENLSENVDEAIKNRTFALAKVLNKRSNELKEEECMNKQYQPRILRDNNSRLCRCLDILIELLKLTSVQCIPHALMDFKQSFLNLASEEYNIDVYRRVFKLCGIMAVNDETCARDYFKVICTPISLFVHGEENDVDILETSLYTLVDLMDKYGMNMFSEGSENNTQNDLIAVEPLINTFLYILEDPNENVQFCVSKCLSKFIYLGRFVNSQLLTEMIMRCNNLSKYIVMRETLRFSIEHYICSNQNNSNVITKALVEILKRINPCSNSLADKKVAALLKFIISVLNMNGDHIPLIQNNIFLHALQCIREHEKNKFVKIWLHIILYVNIKISDKQSLLNIENKIVTILSNVDKLVNSKLNIFLKKVKNRTAELS